MVYVRRNNRDLRISDSTQLQPSLSMKFAIIPQTQVVALSVFGIMTSTPPKFTTPWIAKSADRDGRNLTNDVQRWRRMDFANPNFGVLGVWGIYAACGSIFEIINTRRAEMARKSLNFATLHTHYCGRSYRF